jgi:aminoglycoside phosphotransferase (APT) family kinase protein
VNSLAGIDAEPIEGWLTENVPSATAPFRYDLITGGHSNLTYGLTDARDHRFVLRRPPLGQLLASAHDMVREYRLISALADTPVPVPSTLGLCEDVEITGAPFYVMEFVEGIVIRDKEMASALLDAPTRSTVSRSLVSTLAAIHSVDVDAVGLGDLGAREGYIARQLRRWKRQWDAQKTRDLPMVDQVHARLETLIPDQQASTIVHGDFKIDNCLLAGPGPSFGEVIAVLDWEICTLGDPLADLGMLLAYWERPGRPAVLWSEGATQVPGFLDRPDLIRIYSEITGRDLSQLSFYIAFAYWKLACIIEGVYSRYLAGGLATASDQQLARFKSEVETAAQCAEEVLDSRAAT